MNKTPEISGIFCLSLPGDAERRENAVKELGAIGLEGWRWHDGVANDSDAVSEELLSGRVAIFPPCFRCGKDECRCENNFLSRSQIAVCLAYRGLWSRIAGDFSREEDLFLLCEDDIVFTGRAREGLDFILGELGFGKFDLSKPVLVRMGWALCSDHEDPAEFSLRRDLPKMSNPCYLLNLAMVKSLLTAYTGIDHTVDVFTHRKMASSETHFTVYPPIAYEHSWSTGKLESAIFDRKVRADYLRRRDGFIKALKSFFFPAAPPAKVRRKRVELRDRLYLFDEREVAGIADAGLDLPEGTDGAVYSFEKLEFVDGGGAQIRTPEWGVAYRELACSASFQERAGSLPRPVEVAACPVAALGVRGSGIGFPGSDAAAVIAGNTRILVELMYARLRSVEGPGSTCG